MLQNLFPSIKRFIKLDKIKKVLILHFIEILKVIKCHQKTLQIVLLIILIDIIITATTITIHFKYFGILILAINESILLLQFATIFHLGYEKYLE